MIAPQTFNNYPEFGVAAVKCCPDAAKYANGYIQGDVLPAEHLNWFLSGATVGVSALQLGMDSLEKEMQSLLCCAGITPSGSCNSQIYDAVMYQIQASANTKAPNMHASSANTYGVGNADCYGHLKLSDTYSSVLSACSGVAASQKAMACVYGVANGKPNLGNTAGCALGTASAGTANTAARSDHVHPVTGLATIQSHTSGVCGLGYAGSYYCYLRTPQLGLLPYGSNANGCSCLGADEWPFLAVHAKTFYGFLCGNAYRADNVYRNAIATDVNYHLALFPNCTDYNVSSIYVSNGCSLTFNPSTGTLKTNCFDGLASCANLVNFAKVDDGYNFDVTFINSNVPSYTKTGISCGCPLTFNPATGVLKAKCFCGTATCACCDGSGYAFGTAARCAASAFRSCTWRPYDYCTVSSCVSATRDDISGHWTVTAARGSLICDVWKAICWVTGGLLYADSVTGVVGCYRTSNFDSQNISRVNRNTNFNYFIITSSGSTETSIAICCSCTSAICGLALGGINIL